MSRFNAQSLFYISLTSLVSYKPTRVMYMSTFGPWNV